MTPNMTTDRLHKWRCDRITQELPLVFKGAFKTKVIWKAHNTLDLANRMVPVQLRVDVPATEPT